MTRSGIPLSVKVSKLVPTAKVKVNVDGSAYASNAIGSHMKSCMAGGSENEGSPTEFNR